MAREKGNQAEVGEMPTLVVVHEEVKGEEPVAVKARAKAENDQTLGPFCRSFGFADSPASAYTAMVGVSVSSAAGCQSAGRL